MKKLKPGDVVVFKKDVPGWDKDFSGVELGHLGVFVEYEQDPDWPFHYCIRYIEKFHIKGIYSNDGTACFHGRDFDVIGEL